MKSVIVTSRSCKMQRFIISQFSQIVNCFTMYFEIF